MTIYARSALLSSMFNVHGAKMKKKERKKSLQQKCANELIYFAWNKYTMWYLNPKSSAVWLFVYV